MSILTSYCINLDKRADRWNECIENFTAHGFPMPILQRWSAFEDSEFGALGCARSHLLALSDFVGNRSEPYCLILEDDFDFLLPWSNLVERFNALNASQSSWDVLMLAGTSTFAYAENPPGFARVVESHSASGYLVSRNYAAKLMNCFANSVVQLQNSKNHEARQLWVSRFAIDVLWKQLQYTDRWLIFSPAMGHQRPSFSDIEGRMVDYSTLAYTPR